MISQDRDDDVAVALVYRNGFFGYRVLSFPVIALFAYPNAMFVCGVLYNAGLWMDEFFGIIGICMPIARLVTLQAICLLPPRAES